MNVIFEHKVWTDIQHMKYLALFRNDQQIFFELYATTHSNKESCEDDANDNIIQDFQICAFKTEVEKMRNVEETSLKCSHEEVDSQMSFDAKFINAPNALAIRTAATDISVITIFIMPKLFQGLKAWLEVGLTSNNTLGYINVNKINQSLGYGLCCALPGYHASSECDFTASFSRKGKLVS